MRRRALVLQGGSALGAYEIGAIKGLHEQPGFVPDIVTDVSIRQQDDAIPGA